MVACLLVALVADAVGCAAQIVHRDGRPAIVTAAVVSEPAASTGPAASATRAVQRERSVSGIAPALRGGASGIAPALRGGAMSVLDAFAFGGLDLSGDVRALRAGRPVAFLLRGAEPLRLSRQIARVHPELERTAAGIVIEAGKLSEDVVDRHRKPSFVIDSDHPLLGQISETLRGDDTPSAVRNSVAAYFQRPAHGEFWRASHAVAVRAGDCTEYAVVAAAIARRLGRASRVVLGYALLTDGGRGVAIGHAWAEIHDGRRWQRVDATPLADTAAAYLVMAELSDESRGYQRSLVDVWAMLNVSGIEVLSRNHDRHSTAAP